MADLVRLKDSLFANYVQDFRPVQNQSDPIEIDLDMYLISILDVDEVAGIITLSCALLLSWTDYRLVWNPNEFVGIPSFVFGASNVWKPRVYIATSSDDLTDFPLDAFDVRVNSNGGVQSLPGRQVKASCSFDMTKFPRDSQTCVLQLTSWFYSSEELILKSPQPYISLAYYIPNGEWNVDWTSAASNDLGHIFSVLDFSIHLTRQSGFFLISMAVPVILLCFLNPFVFLLPAASGERISYTITIFLSLAVYMTLIAGNMPKVSDPMAGISYFLLGAMLTSCLLILLTIFTLRCDAVTEVQKFPRWIKWLVNCSRPTCGRDKKVHTTDIISGDQTITQVRAIGEEEYNYVIEHKHDLQKEHVTRRIDKCLFYVTLSGTIVMTAVFVVQFWC
ncbi:neuronal acetylcholine receptor subunit alpha-7-like [Pecten maximus]|uniref:neuronal acetylcholine receptor subunit alpha-7-like n=1 Tax=Pecten maximus TaxID=6579 RepID=UPI0014584118|nr:neuronal acetylcholine receptor subunit alpha-7-like [Pecten maximus]